MKPRSGRTIPLYFKVSPQEKEIIEKKMAQLGIHNQRAYLRKMAVDGYAVQVDMSDFKALVSLLRNCANNLNQIAKRVNSTGNLYQEDVADLQERYRALWGGTVASGVFGAVWLPGVQSSQGLVLNQQVSPSEYTVISPCLSVRYRAMPCCCKAVIVCSVGCS